MNLVVLIVILLLVFGGLGTAPYWGHSASWGWGPSGGIGLVVLILIILLVAGRL